MKHESIGLIKWWKAGLEDLLVSTCITRRIRRRAIRDYQIGECQNSPSPFNDNTYNSTVSDHAEGQRLRMEMCMMK